MRCDLEATLPDWIIEHPETLEAFQGLGIDYSCGGKSLHYVCEQQGLGGKAVLEMLRRKIAASRPNTQS